MDNTVGDEDVREDDTGLVDVDGAVQHNDVHLSTLNSLDGGVLESGAVGDSAADDVVGEDAGEVRGGQVLEGGGDGREGAVVRGEDGDVLKPAEGVNEVGLGDGTGNSGKVGLDGGFGNALRDAEDRVDDVDNTAREGDILRHGLAIDQQGSVGETYSSGDVGLGLQGTVDSDIVALLANLDDLSSGDVRVSLVGEQRGNELDVLQILSSIASIEDVVRENGDNGARVGGNLLHDSAVVEEGAQGIVARSQDRDIGQV